MHLPTGEIRQNDRHWARLYFLKRNISFSFFKGSLFDLQLLQALTKLKVKFLPEYACLYTMSYGKLYKYYPRD